MTKPPIENNTHQRWIKKLPHNRYPPASNAEHPDEWTAEQCLMCQYYIKLSGDLGYDWGVCSNVDSPLDGKVMFEHDGCEYFTFAEDET
jgi:DUF3027 family protein